MGRISYSPPDHSTPINSIAHPISTRRQTSLQTTGLSSHPSRETGQACFLLLPRVRKEAFFPHSAMVNFGLAFDASHARGQGYLSVRGGNVM